jgi:formate dehydrogenase subunit gamma
VQREFGCVPSDAVPAIAEALNLSRADVHGVLTFYHDFRRAPAGRRHLQICLAEACQARGAAELRSALENALDMKVGETRLDGSVTLESAYCLGLCASGPAALLDGEPTAQLSGEKLRMLLLELRS